MKENKKSEFLSKVEEFAKETQEMVSSKDAKRSIIVLATESVENDDAMHQIIGIAGSGQELIRSIAKFANQEDTRPILRRGAFMEILEILSAILEVLIACGILATIVLLLRKKDDGAQTEIRRLSDKIDAVQKQTADEFSRNRMELSNSLDALGKKLDAMTKANYEHQISLRETVAKSLSDIRSQTAEQNEKQTKLVENATPPRTFFFGFMISEECIALLLSVFVGYKKFCYLLQSGQNRPKNKPCGCACQQPAQQ